MNKFYNTYKSKNGYETNLIRFLYLLSLPVLLSYSYINYTQGLKTASFIDIATLLMLSVSIFLLNKRIKQNIAKIIILFSLLLLHTTALLIESYAYSSLFWFFLFPPIALFLFDMKKALIWIAGLVLIIMLTIQMIYFSIISSFYTTEILYILILVLAIETYVINYSHSVMLGYKSDLEKSNNELIAMNELVEKYFLIIRTDIYGNIIHVNDTFIEVSQYSKDKLINSHIFDLCKDSSVLSSNKESFKDILINDHFDALLEYTKADGSSYWIDAHIVAEYDENKSQIGFLIFQQEVTQTIELEKASITDTLTKVNNRVHFDEVSNKRLIEKSRYEINSSLIICDIDDFKSINDRYGHVAGDEVLKRVAILLQNITRASDTLARWGGEEFTILLPSTELEDAVSAANKMRSAIESYDFGFDKEITASFGVSMTLSDDTKISWFNRADKALYKAKESGRNKVCFF